MGVQQNILDANSIKGQMPGVGLLVVDEAHHTDKQHPFWVLLSKYHDADHTQVLCVCVCVYACFECFLCNVLALV